MVVEIMVPFWVPSILGAGIIIGIQKGTIILTTTHIRPQEVRKINVGM